MKRDFQDRIDDYILGRMSGEEKAQFEAEINEDSTKREQFEFTKKVKDAISSREEKLSRMRQMQRRYSQAHVRVRANGTDGCCCPAPAPENIEQKPQRRVWRWWVSGIAAVLIIGLLVVSPSIYDSFFADDMPAMIMRGDGNEIFVADSCVVSDSIINDTIAGDTTIVNGILNEADE